MHADCAILCQIPTDQCHTHIYMFVPLYPCRDSSSAAAGGCSDIHRMGSTQGHGKCGSVRGGIVRV